MKHTVTAISLTLILGGQTSIASVTDPVSQLLNDYTAQGATTFSVNRGQALWEMETNGRRCASCHTENPRAEGQHQKTRTPITALAPSVNTKRLTQIKTIRKWLKRNCKWTLGRECTPQEKGDFLSWLNQQ